MNYFTKSLIVSAALGMASCAGDPTMVQGPFGRYKTEHLEGNLWKTTYRGSGSTSDKKASDLSQLKAAEVTKAAGDVYFAIVDPNDTNRMITPRPEPKEPEPTAMDKLNSLFAPPHSSIIMVNSTIRTFSTKPANGYVYDADEVIRTMKAKYDIR